MGKTELVKKFVSDKPHVYFLAESTSEKEQLHRFSQTVGRFFKVGDIGDVDQKDCRHEDTKARRILGKGDRQIMLVGEVQGSKVQG